MTAFNSHSAKVCCGFTLIELSIVLVIIGLVAGGIFIGRDMIHNAMVLSQIRQVEELNTVIHTFRNKYNAYPGDIRADKAANFQFTARSGARGSGDENGLIEGCDAGSGSPTLGCEFVLFWADLSAAKIINNTFNTATDSTIEFSTPEEAHNYFPAAKLEPSYQVLLLTELATPAQGWFTIMQLTEWHSDNTGGWAADIKTIDAYSIDSKIDDGHAMTGNVNGLQFFNLPGDLYSNDTPVNCIYNGEYNLTPTNVVGCQLNVKASGK